MSMSSDLRFMLVMFGMTVLAIAILLAIWL
jgi:hypothetical protein